MSRPKRQTYAEQVIGPRQVGGIYKSGYWGITYEVLAIDTAKGELTERDLDGRRAGQTRTHCTAWDPKRDKVIQQPTP